MSFYNILIALISLAALTASWVTAARQRDLVKRSTHLPAYMAFLDEFRSVLFHDQYRYVCNQLDQDHDPKLGISGLPDDIRKVVYDVVYYHQNFAALIRMGVLDERVIDHQISINMGVRSAAVWDALEPFIRRERKLNSTPTMLQIFEDFAHDSRSGLLGRRDRHGLRSMLHRPKTRSKP